MAHHIDLPRGRIVQVERNYATVQVTGQGEARLDIFIVRRTIGCRLDDLRHLLSNGVQVKVKLEPLSQATLSKIPAQFRRKVANRYRYEVTFFRKDYQAIQQPAQYRDPARYFADLGLQCDLPRELIAQAISALLHITSIWNNTPLQTVLRLVKSRMSNFDSCFPDQNSLQRFIESQPQFFSISNSNVRRYEGFSEEDVNAAISTKLEETGDGRNRQTPRVAATDIIARTDIIQSVGEAKTVLRKVLDPHGVSIVVGLDCEGVSLGEFGLIAVS